MIVDNESIKKYGHPPYEFIKLAESAFSHGKLFSQGKRCIYVMFIDKLKSWAILDNFCRENYKSILYCIENNKFYAYSNKSMTKVSYNNNLTHTTHANQFFMPGIVDNLFSE